MRSMSGHSRVLVLVPLVFLLLACCSDECVLSTDNDGTSIIPPNKAPESWLSVSEVRIEEGTIRIHFNWGGSDSDGEVIRYQYTISVSGTMYDWYNIHSTDSMFVFVNYQYPPPSDYVFYLRAIDDDLMMDQSPATCAINYE